MTEFEIGVQDDRDVVLLITTREGDHVTVTRCPLAPDEARELVNGLGEAIKHLSGVMA